MLFYKKDIWYYSSVPKSNTLRANDNYLSGVMPKLCIFYEFTIKSNSKEFAFY